MQPKKAKVDEVNQRVHILRPFRDPTSLHCYGLF